MSQEISQNKTDRLGSGPLAKLLVGMCVPPMFGMLVQALYNIVDSIYISRIENSEKALSALSYVFPVQTCITAFSLCVAMGTSILVSKHLGERDKERTNSTATNGFCLAIINAVLFMIVGIFFSKLYFSMFTDDADIIRYGTIYMRIIMVFSFGVLIEAICSRVIQGTGNMKDPLLSQMIGVVTNIILDPLFIFGIGFFPKLGVTGAAIATVIGQILAMLYLTRILFTKTENVKISIRHNKLNKKTIAEIIQLGLPVFSQEFFTSIAGVLFNGILSMYSATAIAVYGIGYKLQQLLFLLVAGMSLGGLPVLSYNFGAKNKDRFLRCLKYLLIASTVLMIVGLLVFNVFLTQIVGLFATSTEMREIAQIAFRSISFSFIFIGANTIIMVAFQSVGRYIPSLLITSFRVLVLAIPAAWILGKVFGLDAIWLAFAVGEGLCCVIFSPIAYKIFHSVWHTDN